jgi:AraC-like DNA-binding protein
LTECASGEKIPARIHMKASEALLTVSVRSVGPVLERLRALGVDPATVLACAGVDPAVMRDPDGRIPHAVALAVWHEAVRQSGDDAFGIHAAEQIRPGAFDVLDYATRSSATLGEGLGRLVRYHRVLHDAAVVQLRLEADVARLTHALPGGAAELPRHTAEFIVAAWIVVARQATGVEFAPVEVTFQHAPPIDVREHERVFGCPVRFNRPVNGVVLRRALLDTPLIRADPGLCGVLDRHVRSLIERMPRAAALSDRVRGLVASELSTGRPSAAGVARKLHMSRRSLQRQLEADGTTFRALCDGLRRDLAIRYLREREIAVAEVAFLLGFSEASAFHRAFKRWLGTTPTLYRRSPIAPEAVEGRPLPSREGRSRGGSVGATTTPTARKMPAPPPGRHGGSASAARRR